MNLYSKEYHSNRKECYSYEKESQSSTQVSEEWGYLTKNERFSFSVHMIKKLNPSYISAIEKQFNQLATKWKDETGIYSTTFHKVANDAYLDIIGMGKVVVPFILKDMQSLYGTAHWHSALKALVKENPVPEENLTKNRKIKEAWIEWGKRKKII